MNLKLKDMRLLRNLTQKQIAEYLCCDRSTYTYYELESTDIPYRALIKLAEYYGTSVDFLLGLTQVQTPYLKISKI